MALTKNQNRKRIKRRIRKVISGTESRPRLSVFRSNKEIKASTKVEGATAVGKSIAEKATKAGIETVAFDRNGYLYHGRVKVLADAAREAGLKF